jgi:hypothetical protein
MHLTSRQRKGNINNSNNKIININTNYILALASLVLSVKNSTLTRLIAQEDFITFMRRESFKFYIIKNNSARC